MFYVAAHTRERIVAAEVRKLEQRQAAERARKAGAQPRPATNSRSRSAPRSPRG